ncbi:MAG: molybdate ABC transporter substrate-binding protein [Planctomycetes bacterium]|nr:molybdate ABC transporter substrate-binding protein [Planctomycetota bacterium]
MKHRLLIAVLALAACQGEPAPLRVAAVSSIAPALESLAKTFREKHGVPMEIVAGTAQDFGRRVRTEPFDLVVLADPSAMLALERSGGVVEGSRATLAVGPLAVYGATVDPKDGVATLRAQGFAKLAVVDADRSAYGVATRELIDDLGLTAALASKLVVASDEVAALAQVDKGECQLAIVPLGLVSPRQDGRAWEVPEPLHAGLPHVVGLVQRKDAHPKARELRDFLLGAATQQALAESGWQRGR